MARHLVCLTFDFDNTSSAIARGQTTPTMLSRGDFGVVGAARILEVLERHSIRSTWFIPGHTIESYPEACRAVVRAGHEIGHHGWTHRVPASLTREEEAAELERGNAAIEAIAGRRARGYRSPAWDLSPWSIDLLIEQGFLYDSSLMGDDYLPYQAPVGDVAELEQPLRFGQDSPLVEMPISWSLDDYPVFEYSRSTGGILPGLMNARLVGENWLGDFRYMARQDWGIITYTFHPHVIGRGHRMLMLEALIDQLMSSGATFVAMEDAVAEYRERWPAGRSWGA
jgi:peptidoglycan-N-acetylglucosamine deacetylase